jgi:hypothetical protein
MFVAFVDSPCIPSGCVDVLFWALAKPEYVEGMPIRRIILRQSKPRAVGSLLFILIISSGRIRPLYKDAEIDTLL